MEKNELKTELEKLKEQIHYHNYLYHVLDRPRISDAEFDVLYKRLKKIEIDHPEWITADSPTQRAGAPPADKFEKVKHPRTVFSLSNAFSKDEVLAWYERIVKVDSRVRNSEFVVEPKFDGLTVVLHYENGIFVQGVTRGDGEIGENITHNIKTIKSLPLKIPVEKDKHIPPEKLVIRGEALIKKADFAELNRQLEEKGERTYQNPRNTAAGSLRQLDPALTAERPLTLFVYSILSASVMPVNSQWELLQYLSELGFPISNLSRKCENIHEVFNIYDQWEENRADLPFEVDGLVIKVDDLRLAEDLGFVGKDPRGALAFKFRAKEVITRLNDIGVNVGRSGVLTPYAILEHVEVGGVLVKQATLHNFDYIHQKDIRIGDHVLLKRAGDVIPYVIGPIIEMRNGSEKIYHPPQKCPSCGEKVQNYEGEVAWYCVNSACPAQLIRNLEHFSSRSAMNIEGLGIKIIELLVSTGLVNDVADLYALHRDNLKNLDGFAEKKAYNLEFAIQASKKNPLHRLIYSLGIKGIGEKAANELALRFLDLDQLRKATIEDLQEIEGFGPNMAQSIVDWFNNPQNLNVLMKLRQYGIWPIGEPKSQRAQKPLSNKTFAITGSLSNFSREEIKEYIQNHGGKISESVGKGTDFLICGESPGSKLDKAKTLGVEIISEEQLIAMVK